MSEKTRDAILKFRNEREWKRFHNSKDLSLSLSLKIYQWIGQDLGCEDKIEKIK